MAGRRAWTRRLQATVFVDDYVRGRLPGVCVVTGVSTRSKLGYRRTIDSPSSAWFVLLLFPPIGWLILLVIMATGRRSVLNGDLPLSDASWQQFRRLRNYGIYVGLGAIVPIALIPVSPGFLLPILLFAAIAAVIGGIITYQRANAKLPQVYLDASGRWVTLRGVHPSFVEAVQRADEASQVTRP